MLFNTVYPPSIVPHPPFSSCKIVVFNLYLLVQTLSVYLYACRSLPKTLLMCTLNTDCFYNSTEEMLPPETREICTPQSSSGDCELTCQEISIDPVRVLKYASRVAYKCSYHGECFDLEAISLWGVPLTHSS